MTVQDDRPEFDDAVGTRENIWFRGLWMVILAVLFGVAEMLLLVFAVLQFLWLLFAKKRNRFVADAGETLARWLQATARYQTAASDDKPFPWRSLK